MTEEGKQAKKTPEVSPIKIPVDLVLRVWNPQKTKMVVQDVLAENIQLMVNFVVSVIGANIRTSKQQARAKIVLLVNIMQYLQQHLKISVKIVNMANILNNQVYLDVQNAV